MLLFLHAAVRALEGLQNRRGTPNMAKRVAQGGHKPKPEDAIAQSPFKALLDLPSIAVRHQQASAHVRKNTNQTTPRIKTASPVDTVKSASTDGPGSA